MNGRMNFEYFIRAAFGYPNEMVGRWGDPAQLADTDIFNERHLNKIKIASGYSMEIFIKDIKGHNRETMADEESNRLDNFVNRILNANNVENISELIENFRITVLEIYYNIENGIMTLR